MSAGRPASCRSRRSSCSSPRGERRGRVVHRSRRRPCLRRATRVAPSGRWHGTARWRPRASRARGPGARDVVRCAPRARAGDVRGARRRRDRQAATGAAPRARDRVDAQELVRAARAPRGGTARRMRPARRRSRDRAARMRGARKSADERPLGPGDRVRGHRVAGGEPLRLGRRAALLLSRRRSSRGARVSRGEHRGRHGRLPRSVRARREGGRAARRSSQPPPRTAQRRRARRRRGDHARRRHAGGASRGAGARAGSEPERGLADGRGGRRARRATREGRSLRLRRRSRPTTRRHRARPAPRGGGRGARDRRRSRELPLGAIVTVPAAHGGAPRGWLELSASPNPCGTPQAVRDAVAGAGYGAYADLDPREAERHLAADAGVEEGCVLLTAGATEALRLIVAGAAGGALVLGPTYGEYARLVALRAHRDPWSPGAHACAAAAVSSWDLGADARLTIAAWRERLVRALAAHGLEAVPSEAPFVLAHAGSRAEGIVRALAHRRIAVRWCASFGLPEHLRVAVRPPGEQEVLVAALAGLRAEARS